jgi:site-specific DNA-methyltransferase (adenine-specific)
MESTLDDIQPLDGREYLSEPILRDDFKVFFDTSENMGEIPDNTVHFWFTSIPYATMRGTMAYDSYTDYLSTMYTIFKEMYRTVRPGRVIAVNVSDYQISAQLDKEVIKGTEFELGEKFDCPSHVSYLMWKLNQEYAEHYQLKYEDTIIWQKSGSTSQRAGTFVDSGNPLKYRPEEVTERILIFRKGDIDYKKIWREKRASPKYDDVDISTFEKFEDWVSVDHSTMRDYIQNIWTIQPETQSDHPAPFPPKLPEVAIKLYSLRREIVGDPFLGSATTLERAQALSRRGVGYENMDAESEDSPDFEQMIKDRTGANSATLDQF